MIYFIFAYYQEKLDSIRSLQAVLCKEGHQVRIAGKDPHTLTHLNNEIRTEKLDAHLVLLPPIYSDVPSLLESIAQTFVGKRPPITLIVDNPERVTRDSLAILPETQVLSYEEFENLHKAPDIPVNSILTTFGTLRKYSLFTVENEYAVMVKINKKSAVPLYHSALVSTPVNVEHSQRVLVTTKSLSRVQHVALSGFLISSWEKRNLKQLEKLRNPKPGDPGLLGKPDEQL